MNISHEGFEMRQVQVSKARQTAAARRHTEDDQILPLDPRDADIVRAKRLARAARSEAGAS